MKGGKHGLLPRLREVLERYKYALAVMAVGILLLLLPTGNHGGDAVPVAAVQEESFDLTAFEEKLSRALSAVEGAGEVRVVLALDEGSRKILAQDREQDGEGYAASTVTLGRGTGSQEVVPLQVLAPSFRGALVVCPGGDDPGVRLELSAAVSALTGLGADRISVCGGKP